MGEQVFRFFAHELARMKIVCQGCGTGIEIKCSEYDRRKFREIADHGVCQFCGQSLRHEHARDADTIGQLAEAIARLGEMGQKVQIEFCLSESARGRKAN